MGSLCRRSIAIYCYYNNYEEIYFQYQIQRLVINNAVRDIPSPTFSYRAFIASQGRAGCKRIEWNIRSLSGPCSLKVIRKSFSSCSASNKAFFRCPSLDVSHFYKYNLLLSLWHGLYEVTTQNIICNLQ